MSSPAPTGPMPTGPTDQPAPDGATGRAPRVTRPLHPEDAEVLAALLVESREFLAPFDADRGEEWFTVEGQVAAVDDILDRERQGLVVPRVIVADGQVVGRINLNNVVRGAFQSASVGYWVGEPWTRRGLASAAVAELADLAFADLGLHRLEAGTLVDNVASQKVLQRNGFERFGLAPRYLRIAGRWQDHVLFQRIAPGG